MILPLMDSFLDSGPGFCIFPDRFEETSMALAFHQIGGFGQIPEHDYFHYQLED